MTAEGATFDEEGAAAPASPRQDRLHRDFRGATEGDRPMRAIGPKLVIATHNAGKLREIRELLAPLGIECVGAAELDLPEPEETGVTFVDNADLKARAAADLSRPSRARRRQRPAASMRSTACPASSPRAGPRTRMATATSAARWSGCGARSRPLAPTPATTRISSARCRSPGPTAQVESFEGKVHGTLVWPPRGDQRLRL